METEYNKGDDGVFKADPERYARLSAPYAIEKEAKSVERAFMADLMELREKHRIAELSVVIGVWTPHPDNPDRRLLYRDVYVCGDALLAYEMLKTATMTHAIALADMLTARQKDGTLKKEDIADEITRTEKGTPSND